MPITPKTVKIEYVLDRRGNLFSRYVCPECGQVFVDIAEPLIKRFVCECGVELVVE